MAQVVQCLLCKHEALVQTPHSKNALEEFWKMQKKNPKKTNNNNNNNKPPTTRIPCLQGIECTYECMRSGMVAQVYNPSYLGVDVRSVVV
jgi:hypothetical protein